MAKPKNNSLFLYTALIFIVAIIMIIISFFGQSNIQKNQPVKSEELNSITEKASQLSEDNRLLMEENKTLLEENRTLRTEISEQTDKNELTSEEKELLQKQIDNDNA